jgi:hypothetical protein
LIFSNAVYLLHVNVFRVCDFKKKDRILLLIVF